MDSEFKEIGARVREARKRLGLSQMELSEQLNISPSHMSDIENGKTNIGLDIFMRLTEALQVSADWLLRTNIPQVNAIQNKEVEDILSGCTRSETKTLIKMMKQMKAALREAKNDKH